MALNDSIVKILEDAKAQILANMQAQNVNASGRTSRAFEVRQVEGGFALLLNKGETATIDTGNPLVGTIQVGRAPLQTLQTGRGPSTSEPPAPRGFYYIIKQWTRDKGMTFNNESERGTFAYFVSRKIIREGTERHKTNIDIYTTPALVARDRLKQTISQLITSSVTLHPSIK